MPPTMNDDISSDICLPITKINDVLNWKCDGKCWIHKHDVNQLCQRTNHLNLGGGLDIRNKSDVFTEYKLQSDLLPKTIFCHDFKGGYLEDRFCNGSPNINTYRFFNWAGIDIFIYFSHHLVTIPPQGWLNSGHSHGVPVLGTLITESKDGENIWNEILQSTHKTNLFSHKLAKICAHFKFDGYLLNVENRIEKDLVPRLVKFVASLKAHLDKHCAKKTWLIWYDSVTSEGELNWQNKLCMLNKPFFDKCDGIFLNYVWTTGDLLQSLREAGHRKFDVFVGVDVWGRNCYQDGGLSVDKAMAVVRNLNMSVALFAPAWTFETLRPGMKFVPREIDFWKRFWNYLYIHGPSSLPFGTNFCQGIQFSKDSGDPLFNLGLQEYQPTGQSCSSDVTSHDGCVSLFLDDGLLHNAACLQITSLAQEHSKLFHRVFVCEFSSANAESLKLKITLAVKNLEKDPSTKFMLYFVIEDKLSIQGKQSVSMNNKPKGFRTQTKCDSLNVVGTVMDFSKATQTSIKMIDTTSDPHTHWHEVHCMVDVNAGVSLTEILILPPPLGTTLWGQLSVEDLSLPSSL